MRTEANNNNEEAIAAAFEEAQNKIDELKREGLIRRVSEITNDEELEDHFDDLERVFQQTFFERGLAWPPPPWE